MVKPVKEYKNGAVVCTVWESEYKGKKNYSCAFKKNYLKNGKWETTEFFSKSDILLLKSIVDKLAINQVKEKNK